MRVALSRMASNTGSSWPGELEMTLSTSDDAVCCSTASTRCSRAFASSRVRASSFFSKSRACDASFFSSSVRGSRTRPTRVLAFVPLERSLRLCVRLFAPLRDKVTPAERRSTAASFNHLVGAGEQHRWHGEAKHSGSRQIDGHLEPTRLHYWQVGRVRALENAAGIDADLTIGIINVGAVAHQPAGCSIVTARIGSGDHVARRQHGKLNPSALKKWVRADKERVGPLAPDEFEGRLDLEAGAGIQNLNLKPDGASSRRDIPYGSLGIGSICRVDEHGHATGRRHQITQEFQPLCHHLTTQKIDACEVATRTGESGNKTKLDRIFGGDENDRDRRRCRLGGPRRRHTSDRRDHRNLPADQVDRQRRQSIDLILRPAVY